MRLLIRNVGDLSFIGLWLLVLGLGFWAVTDKDPRAVVTECRIVRLKCL